MPSLRLPHQFLVGRFGDPDLHLARGDSRGAAPLVADRLAHHPVDDLHVIAPAACRNHPDRVADLTLLGLEKAIGRMFQ